MSKNSVTVIDNRDGQKYEFPILQPTIGPDVVDISTFYKEIGMFTFDRGFTSTASCRSRITYIDGGAGKLMYRGYDISYLATKKTFLDTAYLLLHGKLPSKEELQAFNFELKKRSYINESMKKLFDAFPDHAHPMAILSSAIAALSAFYSDSLDMDTPEEVIEMAHRIIAKIPTIAAFSYRYSKGLPVIYPDLKKGFTENFLYMLRAYPHHYVELKPIEVEALDTIFTLHADHEQNASTTAVRVVASTQAHPYAAISTGVSALWGRAHGGANESVIRQLEMIGSVDNVDKFIAKAKDKEDPFRLMGFGHRVYKNFDPRAKILKNLRNQLTKELDIDSHLLEIANKIEKIALSDEYFVKRNLYPNIDFYSGLILNALKIPKEMFAVIFVMGRAPGWIAQWIELKEQKDMKIARPRQLYLGPQERTPKE
ncbi:MAG: citrate synthase [Campylobacteraceae bacterium]|nr:citrate synthase [Campylobacteraceae bacterium]